MQQLKAKRLTKFILSPLFLVLVIILFSESKPAFAACSYPAQILDLKNWKETLPTGSSSKPTEIKSSALATYSNDPFFRVSKDCDSIIFRAPVNGVTTSGSGYPRSELREMTDGGKKLASWSTTEGTHTLFIDGAITAVPRDKKHIVLGQIHDSEDDVIVVRLEYPKLFVDINGKDGPVLDANYQLGKRFTVKFEAKGGKISVYYNGSSSPAYVLNKKSSGNYFKAGAYTQSNCSKEKDCSSNNYGEVKIYRLLVNQNEKEILAPLAPSIEPVADVISNLPEKEEDVLSQITESVLTSPAASETAESLSGVPPITDNRPETVITESRMGIFQRFSLFVLNKIKSGFETLLN